MIIDKKILKMLKGIIQDQHLAWFKGNKDEQGITGNNVVADTGYVKAMFMKEAVLSPAEVADVHSKWSYNAINNDYDSSLSKMKYGTLGALDEGLPAVQEQTSTSTDLTSSDTDIAFSTIDGGTLSADSKIFTSTASTGFNSHATGDSCTVGSQLC